MPVSSGPSRRCFSSTTAAAIAETCEANFRDEMHLLLSFESRSVHQRAYKYIVSIINGSICGEVGRPSRCIELLKSHFDLPSYYWLFRRKLSNEGRRKKVIWTNDPTAKLFHSNQTNCFRCFYLHFAVKCKTWHLELTNKVHGLSHVTKSYLLSYGIYETTVYLKVSIIVTNDIFTSHFFTLILKGVEKHKTMIFNGCLNTSRHLSTEPTKHRYLGAKAIVHSIIKLSTFLKIQ